MTLKEASENWGVSQRRVNTLCIEGRTEGAIRFGKFWTIPSECENPCDARIKVGKYIKPSDICNSILR